VPRWQVLQQMPAHGAAILSYQNPAFPFRLDQYLLIGTAQRQVIRIPNANDINRHLGKRWCRRTALANVPRRCTSSRYRMAIAYDASAQRLASSRCRSSSTDGAEAAAANAL